MGVVCVGVGGWVGGWVCVCVCVCVCRVGASAAVVDDLVAGILFYPKFPQGSQLGQLYV